MKKIENFMLPEHTNKLYTNEAISSIALTKDVAEKINEIINSLNEFANDDLTWKQEQDGRVRKAVLYMKDNLLNSLNDLMEQLRDSGFIDDRIEYHIHTLQEQLNNAINGMTSDGEVIDSRVDYLGNIDKTLGISLRRQFADLYSCVVNENLFKLNNLDYGYLQTDGTLTAKQSNYSVGTTADVKRFEITSDYIEVVEDETYHLSIHNLPSNVESWFRIITYDSNKNVIASVDRTYTNYIYVTPAQASFVRISYRSYLTGLLKFEKSSFATPSKEGFPTTIKSLDDLIMNGFVDATTGVLSRPQTFNEKVSNVIEVNSGDIYKLYAYGVYDSWYRIAFYDNNYVFVSEKSMYFNNIIKEDITIPEGASYMRVCARTKGMKMFTLINSEDTMNNIYEELFIGYTMNKPNMSTPLKSIAHRGLSSEAPENTLPAFKLAINRGFKYIECDVVMTSDNIPVLFHDDTLNRVVGNDGNVRDYTYNQLKALDFGYSAKFGDTFKNTSIMTLDEFIKLCRNTGIHPYIELKSGIDENGIKKCVDIVRANGMINNCTWISFSKTELLNVLECCPYARIGYVYDTITDECIKHVLDLITPYNEVFIDTNYLTLTNEAITKCMDINIPVECYTVNDEDSIKNLPSYVNGVTSDGLLANNILSSMEV